MSQKFGFESAQFTHKFLEIKQISKHFKSHIKQIMKSSTAVLVFALHQFRSKKPHFNSTRAFGYLQKQCDLGPRTPGATAHQNCRRFILETLNTCTSLVLEQAFQYQDRKKDTLLHQGTRPILFFTWKA